MVVLTLMRLVDILTQADGHGCQCSVPQFAYSFGK